MKSNTISLVMSSSAMSGTSTITSAPIPLDQIYGFAVQAVWTGTPTGSLKLQGSCDIPLNGSQINAGADLVTNWTDIASPAPVAIAGAAGSALLNAPDVGYRHVRLVYVNASGTGVLTVAQIMVKGV